MAVFEHSQLADVRTWLVTTRHAFDRNFTRLHGIGAEQVKGAASWPQVYATIAPLLQGRDIASHTYFDRWQMFSACAAHRCTMFSYGRWVDTHAVARRRWPHLASHSLSFLAEHFGLPYRAHDAGEDARVAGLLFLAAQAGEAAERYLS